MVTFRELEQDTHRRVREATGSGVYFATEDIRDAVNAGYHELSDASEWLEEQLEIETLNGRPYYDLSSLIGGCFLSLKPAFDQSRSRWLIPATVRQLDGKDRRWEGVVGTPQRILVRGLRWLGLFPRTSLAGELVTLHYTRLPEYLVAADDEPGFPEAYHVGCVYFALADLFAQDGETALALAAWTDYLDVEAKLTAWVQGRTRRPLTRVLGGAA